jgi:LPS export ABC transporter protein LptC
MRLLCLLSIGWLLACSEPDVAEKTLETPAEAEMGVESFGVEYVYTDSAKLAAKLHAAHVIEKTEGEGNQASTVHYFSGGVEIEFFDPIGRPRSHMTSKEGVLYREKRIAEMRGDVVLTNYKGERLETEQLFWDDQKDSIYTTKFIRIETPDKIITGSKGLRSNTSFTAYTIYGIRGEIEAEDKPAPRRPGPGRQP